MEPRKLISIEPVETRIPKKIYDKLESVIWEEINNQPNPEEAIAPYEFPFENIQKIANSDNIEYKENVRDMADDIWSKDAWLDALIVYYILMHIITYLPTDFFKLAHTLAKLNRPEMAQELIPIYEQVSTNKKVTYHAIANFYYTAVNIPYKAIEYFEKYIEIDSTNPNAYTSLGHCYGKINDEVSNEKQLNAYKKAYELKPNDGTIVKSLLTAYEKRHDIEKIKEFYPKLINIMPTPRHSLNYGLYLMSWGKLQEGYKYFIERVELDDYPIGYPKGILNGTNRWNYESDISDKTLVIHYEEGFGDSIMYGRFLPLIKQYAKKTVLIVQPQLVNLFKSSKLLSDGIEILGDIKEFINKYPSENFVHMPLMDMPYPLGVDTHFIPYTNSYITAINPTHFDKTKINIGIAYNGDTTANYNGRDIELREFFDLAKNPKIQLYSLQVGESAKQLDSLPENISIIDLGKRFNDFTDTANAIAGLDLIVTSDNVILNLAGAIGAKTYGLFNKYPNYRWFDLSKDNVQWYDSVKPFQCEKENDWTTLIKDVTTEINKEFLQQ